MPERVQRLHARITGLVQGVGFRPFVHRLARELSLLGWVRNFPGGVELSVEGGFADLQDFLLRLEKERPEHSVIYSLESRWLSALGETEFVIRDSETTEGDLFPSILPDIAPCPHCLAEIRDAGERRYGYPFTNCTHCGPRFTIMQSVPYDRKRTVMRAFPLCAACEKEYGDPEDRRFHAQPMACPFCGPELYLLQGNGEECDRGRSAEAIKRMLREASALLSQGGILALMGVGGVQLLVDAENEEAVTRLRARKGREAKPLAVMVSSLEQAHLLAELNPQEEALLKSPEAPIVLLKRKEVSLLAPSVSSFSPWVGVMLPSSPLHYLLMDACKGVLVVTSGNLSGEPMCLTGEDALSRLGGVADMFLLHTRPIVRQVDDSVARVVAGRVVVLRRARGYAPLPLGRWRREGKTSPVILALGGHLKNTVALYGKGRSVLSQHIGDMETESALAMNRRTRADLEELLGMSPELVAIDSHPDYLSSQEGRLEAERRGLPVVEVQHHVAHVLSCMEENEMPFPALGVAWDGTGYGTDGRIWGGEFFEMREGGWERKAHWRYFRLPGSERAVREPGRVALSLLSQLPSDSCVRMRRRVAECYSPKELELVEKMLERGINSPQTSGTGRLFDAMAFLLGFDGEIQCEGQAAVVLEGWAWEGREEESLPLPELTFGREKEEGMILLDWRPVFVQCDALLCLGFSPRRIAYAFHVALAGIIVTLAKEFAMKQVAVGGGCFQNSLLLELLITATEKAGLTCAFPQRVPSHDGGLALGQLAALLHHYPSS